MSKAVHFLTPEFYWVVPGLTSFKVQVEVEVEITRSLWGGLDRSVMGVRP